MRMLSTSSTKRVSPSPQGSLCTSRHSKDCTASATSGGGAAPSGAAGKSEGSSVKMLFFIFSAVGRGSESSRQQAR